MTLRAASGLVGFRISFLNGDHKISRVSVQSCAWVDAAGHVNARVLLAATDNSRNLYAEDWLSFTVTLLVLVTADDRVGIHHGLVGPPVNARSPFEPTRMSIPWSAAGAPAPPVNRSISGPPCGRALLMAGFELSFSDLDNGPRDDHNIAVMMARLDQAAFGSGQHKITASAVLADRSGTYDDSYFAALDYSWLELPQGDFTVFEGQVTMDRAGSPPEAGPPASVMNVVHAAPSPSVVALRGFELEFSRGDHFVRSIVAGLGWPTPPSPDVRVDFRGGLQTQNHWDEGYRGTGYYTGIVGAVHPLAAFGQVPNRAKPVSLPSYVGETQVVTGDRGGTGSVPKRIKPRGA